MPNIIEAIKNELTGDLLEKLAGATGASADSVKSAANVATPALLSALAGLASTAKGMDQILSTLKGFGDDSFNKLRSDVLEGGGDVQKRGDDILGSLLGSALPVLVKVLAQFEKIDPELVKKLLGFLAPMIMSVITGQLKSKGGLSASALSGFFAEQKSNIAGAIPQGLSLAGLPSFPTQQLSAAAGEANVWTWLAPLLGLAAVGLLIWYAFLRAPEPPPVNVDPVAGTPVPREAPPIEPGPADPSATSAPASETPAPAVEAPAPTAAEVTKSLGEQLTAAIASLSAVVNPAAADEQLPTLTNLGVKIDNLKAQWDKLADAEKQAVSKSIEGNREIFKTLVDKVLMAPDLAAKLKDLLDSLLAKLASFSA